MTRRSILLSLQSSKTVTLVLWKGSGEEKEMTTMPLLWKQGNKKVRREVVGKTDGLNSFFSLCNFFPWPPPPP